MHTINKAQLPWLVEHLFYHLDAQTVVDLPVLHTMIELPS